MKVELSKFFGKQNSSERLSSRRFGKIGRISAKTPIFIENEWFLVVLFINNTTPGPLEVVSKK